MSNKVNTDALNRDNLPYSDLRIYRFEVSETYSACVRLEDCWYKQDPQLSKVSSKTESWSISTQHIPIYISPSHRVLSSPPLSLRCPSYSAFRAAHPCRNDLLGDLEALSAMLRLFGEGLRHFVWNNKERWQSVVLTVLLFFFFLKAPVAELHGEKNLHDEMKRTVSCGVKPSLLVRWWGGMGNKKSLW